jgi:predicted DNA-binding transcriptional regulator AlpA
MEKDKFLRIDDVLNQIPVSRATLYRLSKKIKLLKPLKVGGSSFWSQENINTYFKNLKNDNLAA